MTGIDDRKKGFENKYAHEERLSFEVEARCAKLFGLWAAEKIGLTDADAHTYAMSVVEANLDIPGFDDIFGKVMADFQEKGLKISEDDVWLEIDRALQEAKRQLFPK